MNYTILAILNSLACGGCIYRHTDHAEVYPLYSECEWAAYDIPLRIFWEMYVGGLIEEYYDPTTLEFQFYDISIYGERTRKELLAVSR